MKRGVQMKCMCNEGCGEELKPSSSDLKLWSKAAVSVTQGDSEIVINLVSANCPYVTKRKGTVIFTRVKAGYSVVRAPLSVAARNGDRDMRDWNIGWRTPSLTFRIKERRGER
jgi:hypothetical protein